MGRKKNEQKERVAQEKKEPPKEPKPKVKNKIDSDFENHPKFAKFKRGEK